MLLFYEKLLQNKINHELLCQWIKYEIFLEKFFFLGEKYQVQEVFTDISGQINFAKRLIKLSF